ncbi:MAG: NAD(P)H-binding protein [Nitrospiraceae bacterium]|nr:NAD(P)H-binding protein [Nitrospiraceae bacterium]
MRIAVIGASAGVGLELVDQLLDRGHSVITLSRSIETIPDHPNIKKIRGSSLNQDDIAKAINNAEAVLVTLGTGMSTKATGLYPGSASAILSALQQLPAKPLLIGLTGFGAGDSWNYNSFLMKLLFNLFLKDAYAEKTQMEQLISKGYPNSMFVRPGRLTKGPLSKTYRVVTALDARTRIGAISRKDVAHFMAEQAEHPDFIGKYPALSY